MERGEGGGGGGEDAWQEEQYDWIRTACEAIVNSSNCVDPFQMGNTRTLKDEYTQRVLVNICYRLVLE